MARLMTTEGLGLVDPERILQKTLKLKGYSVY
jgi:hypothetical protein